MRSVKRILAITLGFGLALVGASTARAAIWVEFHPPSAAGGTTVEVRGYGFRPLQTLEVFLTPKDAADSITSPDDPRLIRIGVLTGNENGEGSFLFVVPNVPPGVYEGMIHCETCAPYSAGRIMVPGEYLTIVPPTMPKAGTMPSNSDFESVMQVIVGLSLIISGLGLNALARRFVCDANARWASRHPSAIHPGLPSGQVGSERHSARQTRAAGLGETFHFARATTLRRCRRILFDGICGLAE
jgi:hypothetical protein